MSPLHEVLGLTEWHEAVGLQIEQAERSEVVIEHQGIHVFWPKIGPGPEVSGSVYRLRHGNVGAVDNSLIQRP